MASILTLTLIACDRFFGIVFAMRAHVASTDGRRWWICVGLLWTAAVVVSAPLLFHRTQLTRHWLNHTEIWCADTWPYVEQVEAVAGGSNRTLVYSLQRRLYYTSVTLVLFFIPVVVMTLAYVVIMLKLWSHKTPGDMPVHLAVKRKVRFMFYVPRTLLHQEHGARYP